MRQKDICSVIKAIGLAVLFGLPLSLVFGGFIAFICVVLIFIYLADKSEEK